jgi:UDP-2,3-diacylglucosamine pyrophosphatase LpxH
MVDTLQKPDYVYYSPGEENFHYFKFFKETPVTEKYLLLIQTFKWRRFYNYRVFRLKNKDEKQGVSLWKRRS